MSSRRIPQRKLHGRLGIPRAGIPQVTIATKVTMANVAMVTKVSWGFPAQSIQRAETHVGLNVKCPFFVLF